MRWYKVKRKKWNITTPPDAMKYMHSIQDTIARSHAHFGLLINDTGKNTFAETKKAAAKELDLDTSLIEIKGRNVKSGSQDRCKNKSKKRKWSKWNKK